MRTIFLIGALCWGLGSAGVATADDVEDPFAGRVPGVPVADEELEAYSGRGFQFSSFPGGVNNGSVSGSVSSTVASDAFGNSQGIVNVTQFNGDYNTVSVSVNLSVNINTTTITNSSGLSVGVSNGFSLSGGQVGVMVSPP